MMSPTQDSQRETIRLCNTASPNSENLIKSLQ